MKIIAIKKTVGDLEFCPPEHAESHPAFPIEVQEFDTIDEAAALFSDDRLMTQEEYLGYKRAMNLTHGTIKKPKPPVPEPETQALVPVTRRPWWRFWS